MIQVRGESTPQPTVGSGSGCGLNVRDFDGVCQVERDDELLARLRSVRRGIDGAFILDHGGDESLWVHIRGDAAFLWVCPGTDGKHPGFVPDGMWPGEHQNVRFLQVSGREADAITVLWQQLVPVETAYRAAVEYLHRRSLPESIRWFEL
jgi:hypothetical protein